MPETAVDPDPYNLRLTRQDTFCLSGVRIPPGLVGFCHETPLSPELFARQAPELATVQNLLHELRRQSGLLATFEVVERYRSWADRWLGTSSCPEAEEGPAPAPNEEKRER